MRKILFLISVFLFSSSFSLVSLNLIAVNKSNINQTINSTLYLDIYFYNQTIPPDLFDSFGSDDIDFRPIDNSLLILNMRDPSNFSIGNCVINFSNGVTQVIVGGDINTTKLTTNILLITLYNDYFEIFNNSYKGHIVSLHNLTHGIINNSRVLGYSEGFFNDSLVFFNNSRAKVLLTFPNDGDKIIFNTDVDDPNFINSGNTLDFNYERFHSLLIQLSSNFSNIVAKYGNSTQNFVVPNLSFDWNYTNNSIKVFFKNNISDIDKKIFQTTL